MEIKDVFEIAGAVFAGLGGGSAIVFGLSSWLGKVWASRILENEKAEHSKDLEHYKRKLSEELDKVKFLNDKALYVSKTQYDNEYRIYLEIWSALNEAIIYSEMLYPIIEETPEDQEEKLKFKKEKYENFAEKYNVYSCLIDKYAPFYKKEFYDSFKEVRKLCGSLGNIFKIYELDSISNEPKDANLRKEIYRDIPQDLDKLKDDLQQKIRDYLLSLQLTE